MKNKVFLTSLKFNDGKELAVSENDIVIFTGANNCGKSQILRDILSIAIDQNTPNKIVVKELAHQKEGVSETVKSLFSHDGRHYRYADVRVGDISVINTWWTGSSLHSLSSIFINHLTTDKRLSDSNNAASYNVINELPINPIQIMYAEDDKAVKVSELFYQAFDNHLSINRSGGNKISLHVGAEIEWTKENDRTSKIYVEKLLKQPTLEKQGDGMRSYASILMNILTAEQTITLIDEPEAFLHPPQTRLLGRMLVKNKPNDRQLFISTHSEDFLKGILDSDSQNIKIVRINREENINKINVLGNTDITELWSNPLLRYSNILSGLFHRKVVVCESDTDCRFYQAVMNAMFDGDEHVSPDILFTHCGGKDRIHTVVSALRSLNVDVVATPDIDILNDKRKFEIITTSFGVNWADISTYWTVIDNYVKSQRHQLTTEEVKSKIEEILSGVTDTSLPKVTAKEINKTVKMASAWTKIKATGITFFSGTSAYTAFQEIDKICRSKGLFIVPEGEIESFCRVVQGHSNDWLNDVLIRDLKAGEEFEQARRFVNDIIQENRV